MSELLAARGIAKNYQSGQKTLEVIKGINLTVERGESLSVVGISGAGKSTLLHILAGLDSPSQGEVFWQKSPLSSLGERERDGLRKNKMGFIFQFYHLLPEFSALENVLFPALIPPQKESFSVIREKGMTLLEDIGLAGRANHKPTRLSGGEQQRVAIARALINEPEIIFADEPTGNLDRQSGGIIEKLLFEKLHKEKGKALILVSHEEFLTRKADKMMRLKEGRLEVL